MVVYNYSGKEINAKIVYYGPALSGKTTNLEWIYSKIPVEYSGKMVSLRTQADRTIFFDFLPLDLGMIDGFRTRFMLYTVPGQVHYNATRKMVLKGVDGLVFVADSEPGRMAENIESLQNLRDNLQELGMNPDALPLVMQWNKRDLPACMSVSELETRLNPRGLPSFEACALTGEGVYETLHKASRLIYTKLTGQQSNPAGEDVSLFGESIAQCLQDVDVPKPVPEAVALGPDDGAPVRSSSADPLGAILGREAASGAAPPPTSDTRTRPVPVAKTGDAPSKPISISMGPQGDDAPRDASGNHGLGEEPLFSAPSSDGGDAHQSGSLSRPVPALSHPIEPVDDASDRLGGLVDEVLSSLDEREDVVSIDAGSSRASEPVRTQDEADEDAGPLADRLEAFFDGVGGADEPDESSSAVSDAFAPYTEDASDDGDDSIPIEHDVDVFSDLQNIHREADKPVEADAAPSDGQDVEPAADAAGDDDLQLITDPRRLPSESDVSKSRPTMPVAAELVDGILEIPVAIDAAALEDDVPLKIVLKLEVKRERR